MLNVVHLVDLGHQFIEAYAQVQVPKRLAKVYVSQPTTCEEKLGESSNLSQITQ